MPLKKDGKFFDIHFVIDSKRVGDCNVKKEYPKKRYAAGISEDERPEAFDGFVSLFSKNCLIKKKIPVQQS